MPGISEASTGSPATQAFGFAGVALGAAAGFLLALAFGSLAVRVFCAFVRAIQDLRFDRAMLLILVTALVNIGVDALARRLRGKLPGNLPAL